MLVRFCVVVWVLFLVFSIFCITSFGNCTRPQHQEPLPVPHANTSPTPPKKKASKCDTPRFAPAVVIKMFFCFTPLSVDDTHKLFLVS